VVPWTSTAHPSRSSGSRRDHRPQAQLEQPHERAVLGVGVAAHEALPLGIDHRRPLVAGAHLDAAVEEGELGEQRRVRPRRRGVGLEHQLRPRRGGLAGELQPLGRLQRRQRRQLEQTAQRLLQLLLRDHHLPGVAQEREPGEVAGRQGVEARQRLREEHEAGAGGLLAASRAGADAEDGDGVR
jgi:hypothetical protein